MKSKLISLTLSLICYTNYSQSEDELLAVINDNIEIIDSYINSEIYALEPEEFLDKMADHGAELNGYYEYERLKKMVRKIGTPSAMINTVFYFWNDQLVYVVYKQEQYMFTKNEQGLTIPDYNNTYTKYESNHYYNKGKEFKKKEVGAPIDGVEPETEFYNYAKKIKKLLDDKYKNRQLFDMLEGKWQNVQYPEQSMMFEGAIRFDFRNDKYVKKMKVSIKDSIMKCTSPKNSYVYRYKIESLTDQDLILLDLQDKTKSERLLYKKIE